MNLRTTDTHLHLLLQDNGNGLQPDANPTGFGLRGMYERAIALDGELTIDSKPGEGCRITAIFPK